MSKKWWKFLLPVPFIFFYCYCVSFSGQKEEESETAYVPLQQEEQATQELQKPPRTTEPPPPPPAEVASQAPPKSAESAAPPVPKSPLADEAASSPASPSLPPSAQAESAPQHSSTRASTPPPVSTGVMQEGSSSPATLQPKMLPESQSTQEEQDAIIALVSLSIARSETEEQNTPRLPAGDEAQQAPLPPASDSQKRQRSEYERSTTKVSVSPETFEADKKHIMNMINDLDRCMEKGDYKGWRNCLSEESLAYWSKAQNLRKAASKLPISGIKLNDMEDYFNYVFIPARKGRQVEEIRYVTETQVKAVQMEGDVDMVFYHFKKVDGKWRLFLPKIKD